MQTSLLTPTARSPVSPPAFARDGGFATFDAPFRGIAALAEAPAAAVISARLSLPAQAAPPLVYWEVGCDPQRARRERHGLLRCTTPGRTVRVTLEGLEPGRVYWYRFWASGHWSHVGHFYSASR